MRPSKTHHLTTLTLFAVAGLSLALAWPNASAEACMALGRTGFLPVMGEEALIVWDAEHETEHFIRRAAFDGISEDFGFIVPTPSRPTLVEVADSVFDRLFALYRRPAPRSRSARARGVERSGPATSGVTVVERTVVAGLEGTILQATSATALDAWLAEHGYASGPELVPYLQPYVAQGWYLTAFRVDASASSGRPVSMRAMRMSFATERPFFPYSEPQTARRQQRPFRVSVVAPTRMSALEGTEPWDASVGYAARSPRLAGILRGVVPAPAVRGERWLTTFDEPSSLRGRSDLFFVPSADTRPVRSTIDRRMVGFGSARE